jgi:predicted XRE-type DNA-binding protein
MSDEIELIRGSGDVFRDVGHPDAVVEQVKSLLAARIIKAMDGAGMTALLAHEKTGIAAADFSRIRNAKLDRFTIDRLMTALVLLEPGTDVRLSVRRKAA